MIEMTLTQFVKACRDGDERIEEFARGVSPGPAAADLKVSRQRLHELMTDGKLEALRLTDHRGELVAILIPQRAIRDRIRALGRRAA